MTWDDEDEEPWVCPKDGCSLDVEHHDLALAVEHIYETDPDEARGIADRTLVGFAHLWGLPTKEGETP